MKFKKFFSLTLSVFLFCSLVYAEKITFSAGTMSGQAGSKNTTTKLSGNAYILTETMEISSDSIELSGEDYRYIKADGNVVGKNLKTNMEFTCANLEYDRESKVASLKGSVKLEDKDNDVKASAQMIEYNQETNIAVLQIGINLTQKDNVCTAAYAVYQKDQQMLELSGNAQIKQNDDTFRAQHITLDMDTQEITLDGNVKGSVKDTKQIAETDGTNSEEKSENNQERKGN